VAQTQRLITVLSFAIAIPIAAVLFPFAVVDILLRPEGWR